MSEQLEHCPYCDSTKLRYSESDEHGWFDTTKYTCYHCWKTFPKTLATVLVSKYIPMSKEETK